MKNYYRKTDLKGFSIDSEITPEEALKLGNEVSQLLAKRYKGQ